MKTNFLRLFAIFWWMTVCTYAMAQHDSIFVQGYINNVLDDEMCFQVMEDMRSVYGLVKSYELKSLPMHILISPEGKWIKRWGGTPIY